LYISTGKKKQNIKENKTNKAEEAIKKPITSDIIPSPIRWLFPHPVALLRADHLLRPKKNIACRKSQ
jgi:hypothetical protein